MPKIKWPDGDLEVAESWEALEESVRADQWTPFSPEEFRLQMQHRALVWSGTEIMTAGDSKTFFEELSRAGLLDIVGEADDVSAEPDG